MKECTIAMKHISKVSKQAPVLAGVNGTLKPCNAVKDALGKECLEPL
jgi:hypothetical protein